MRHRLARHDVALDSVLATVKTIEAQQKQLLNAFDEMFTGLARAKAAISGRGE